MEHEQNSRSSYFDLLPDEGLVLIVKSFSCCRTKSEGLNVVKMLFDEKSPFVDVLSQVFHSLKFCDMWNISRNTVSPILEIGDLNENFLLIRIVTVLANSVKNIITTNGIKGCSKSIMKMLRLHCDRVSCLSIEQAVNEPQCQAFNYQLLSHYAPNLVQFQYKGVFPGLLHRKNQRLEANKVCRLLLEAPALQLVRLEYTTTFMKFVPALLKRCGATLKHLDLRCRNDISHEEYIDIANTLRNNCRELVSICVPPLLEPDLMRLTADIYASYNEKLVFVNVPARMNDLDCVRFLTVCTNVRCGTLTQVTNTNRLRAINRHLRTLLLVGHAEDDWRDVPHALSECTDLRRIAVITRCGQKLSVDNVCCMFQFAFPEITNLKLSFVWPKDFPLDIIGDSTGALVELQIYVGYLGSGGDMFRRVIACNPGLKQIVIKEKRYDNPERSAQQCEFLTLQLIQSFKSCRKLELFDLEMVGPEPHNLATLYNRCNSMFIQQVSFDLRYDVKY